MQLTPPSCQTYNNSCKRRHLVIKFGTRESGRICKWHKWRKFSSCKWQLVTPPGGQTCKQDSFGDEIVAVFEFSFLWFVICLAFAAILSAQLFLCFSSHLVFYLIALGLSWWSCNLTPPQLSPNSLQLLVPLCDCVLAQNDLVKPSLLCSQLCDTSALCKITLSDQDVTKLWRPGG